MKSKVFFLITGILSCVFDFILVYITTEYRGGGPEAPLEMAVIMLMPSLAALLFSLTSIIGSLVCLLKSKKDKMLSFSGLLFGIIGLILLCFVFLAEIG